MKITGRLEGWALDRYHNIVWGYLYEDVKERWWDGVRIHTSLIQSHTREQYEKLQEGDIIHTLNSTYKLGKPFVRPSE